MSSPEKLGFRAFEIARCLCKGCSIWKSKSGIGPLILLPLTAQCSCFEHTTPTCCHALGSLMGHTCTNEDNLKQTSFSSDLLYLSMLYLVCEAPFLNAGRTSHNHWSQIWRAGTGASLGYKTQDLVQKVKAKKYIKSQKITPRQLPRKPNCVRKLAPCSVSDGVVFFWVLSDPSKAQVLMVSR